MGTLWSIAAVLAVTLLAVVVLVGLWLMRRPRRQQPLPTEWSLSARPVFATDERRVYKLLREALPHHIVLSKLPLVRFSQPTNPDEVRYWYDLLGAINVTFAVCSANGRAGLILATCSTGSQPDRLIEFNARVAITGRQRAVSPHTAGPTRW